MPYKTMKAQFDEEGRLHKLKMAEKREKQRQLEELMRERSLRKMKIETEKEVEEDDGEEVKVVVEEVLSNDVSKAATQNVERTDTTVSETALQPSHVEQSSKLVQLSEQPQEPLSPHRESVLQPRQFELLQQ